MVSGNGVQMLQKLDDNAIRLRLPTAMSTVAPPTKSSKVNVQVTMQGGRVKRSGKRMVPETVQCPTKDIPPAGGLQLGGLWVAPCDVTQDERWVPCCPRVISG
uniref:Uncharacterized protein n=1 Tax=Eutreptiella gymnastica TaxID=73025 RepID=A0A7S1IHD5_9EUGL